MHTVGGAVTAVKTLTEIIFTLTFDLLHSTK